MTAFEGEPDIEAEVRFSTTLEGGRNGPVCTNYRPCHDMGIDGMLNDGKHEFVDREWVALGDTVVSRIRFLVPEYQAGNCMRACRSRSRRVQRSSVQDASFEFSIQH